MCVLARIIKDNVNRSDVKTALSSTSRIITNLAGILKDETVCIHYYHSIISKLTHILCYIFFIVS